MRAFKCVWISWAASGDAHDQVATTDTTTTHSRIISTIPPSALDKLVPSLGIPLGPRTSVGVVSLVLPLPPSAIHPEGFGYLIPRLSDPSQNPHGILGVVFDSTALPGLDTAANVTKLTVMMGGPYWSSYRPVLARPTSASELVPLAMDHLRTVFPSLRNVDPVLADPHLHVDCIPTPTPGHRERTKELHHRLLDSPWRSKLSFAGNAWGGIGVNDSVYAAVEVVDGIKAGNQATGMERWA
jgi:oxygen-dependent protoporphyrinogen oxidase